MKTRKIAYSNFFKDYIMLHEYISDEEWYFLFCDKNGKLKRQNVRKAHSNFNCFEWKTIKVPKENKNLIQKILSKLKLN